jgi:hypothetical protein
LKQTDPLLGTAHPRNKGEGLLFDNLKPSNIYIYQRDVFGVTKNHRDFPG